MNILSQNQFGFRQRLSAVDALKTFSEEFRSYSNEKHMV